MKRISSCILIMALLISMTPVGISASDSVFRGKLVFSEDFEGDITKKWEFTPGSSDETIRVTDEDKSEGNNSLYVETGGIRVTNIELKPETTYLITADFKHIEGINKKIFYRIYDSNNNLLDGNSFGSGNKEWTNVEYSFTTPNGASKGWIWITSGSSTVGKTFVDNVKMFEATNDTENNTFDITLPFYETFDSSNAYFCPYSGNNPNGQSISEKYSKSGNRSLHIVDNSDTLSSGVVFNNIPVTEGNLYSLSFDYFRIEAITGAMSAQIRFFDKNGIRLDVAGEKIPVLNEKEWVNHRVIGIAPSGAVNATVVLATIAAAYPLEAYIDNVRFEEANHLSKEFEFNSPEQVAPVDAMLAKPSGGKLEYKEYNEKGDTIGDYSYAGFYKGEYNLPDSNKLPVFMEVSPTGTDDDTAMLQAAINRVYNESKDNNMKILKLKAGTYYINKTGLYLKSGVVLSGEGQGPTGTILYGKDAVSYDMIRCQGGANKVITSNAMITDDYLKSGSSTFEIEMSKAADYKVGDLIIIAHPSTDTWNEAMKMKGITSYTGADTSWDEGETNFYTERTITKIVGNKITVDFPVFVPYNRELAESYIYKIDDSLKLENVGIENLRLDCTYASETDEQHVSTFINIQHAKNVFVRNVTGKHFVISLVASGLGAKQVTVQNCTAIEPISQISGSKRYNFTSGRQSQQILYTNCYSGDGRHDFVTSFQCTGPIVYSDNQIYNSSNMSETHGGWSTGVLYDNVYQTDHLAAGTLAMANRGSFGGSYSHGWSSAGSIMWNCLANSIIAHKPASDYQNFVVGIWGFYDEGVSKDNKLSAYDNSKYYYKTTEITGGTNANFDTDENTPVIGDAYKESVYGAVNPRSLFKAQLAERITGSILNARPNAPMVTSPVPDSLSESNKISVKGIYQLGASKVKVYIDDVCYEATLDTNEQIFTLEKELDDGVHKIYATQFIDDYEGVKTPDRFVIIGEAKGNQGYLQSEYDSSKTTLLVNDPRLTYDEYVYGVNPTYLPGDINGDGSINVLDITMLRRYNAGGYTLNVIEEAVDVNKDGTVNVLDVTILRRFNAGGYGIELK